MKLTKSCEGWAEKGLILKLYRKTAVLYLVVIGDETIYGDVDDLDTLVEMIRTTERITEISGGEITNFELL